MSQTRDVHPLKSRVGDFIAGLKVLEREPITTTRVSEFVVQMQPSPDALAPYLFWSCERYTRNLLYRDHLFEVLVLCWLPGQRTPIHSHNGQLGWLTVVQGELVCRDYRFLRPWATAQMLLPYEERAGRSVKVELQNSATYEANGSVSVVDRQRTTHQIENLEKSPHGSVSLHLYSKPIDSCVVFDETTRCCERRQLQYYSANGVILGSTFQRDEQFTHTAA
ncbi:MAG TPA: cysteine dioxygenase family protein [Terriglobia bacterium]|nr:cysteine dioxygenase family protein [Terriglobia bacterium]